MQLAVALGDGVWDVLGVTVGVCVTEQVVVAVCVPLLLWVAVTDGAAAGPQLLFALSTFRGGGMGCSESQQRAKPN